MNQNSAEQRQDIYLPRPHRSLSERQANHCCPFCSKAYTTSTWLENHIKTKHTTAMAQKQSQMLAHMNNSYRNSVSNAIQLPPSFQETRLPDPTRDLPATVALLKQLLPLMEGLLPILEQLDGVLLCDPPMSRSNLRTPKRCASSPDLRGEQGAKLRELDSSIPGMYTSGNQIEPQNHFGGTESYSRISMNNGDPHGTQYTSSVMAFSEGSQFQISSPHCSRGIMQRPDLEQAQGSEGALSYISTPYFRVPNHRVPQRRHQWRPSQTPESHSQPDNTTPVPHEFLAGYQPTSLSSELIPHQHEDPSDGLNSAELLLGTMQPEPNVQRSYSVEDPHKEVGQHQSILRELQQYPLSTHQHTAEHTLGHCHDDFFQDWSLSVTSAARLVQTMTGEGYHDDSGQSISGKSSNKE